jgi:zinc transporter 9
MDPDGSKHQKKKGTGVKKHPSSVRAILTALFGNFFVMILKFIGWIITSSPSMLAEALHSFADVMNQSLLYAGVQNSKGKATAEHPHGMGSVQYLFNFLSAIGVFTLGCVLTIWHAIHDYLNPTPVSQWWWIGVIILTVSFLTEGYTCYVAVKEIYSRKGRKSFFKYLKQTDDPALIAILLEDSAAMVGIFIALFGVVISKLTANPVVDVVCAILIALMMGAIAWFLGITNAKLLIGKSISKEKEKEYKEFITSLNTVDKISELRTEVLGPHRVYLSFKAELHPTFFINIEHLQKDADEIKNGEPAIKILMEASDRAVRSTAREIVQIEKLIKEKFPEISIIDLELD